IHPRQGPDGLLELQPRRHVHPLPWPRLHGRKHAWTLDRRLRKILRTNRDSIRKYAARNSAVSAAHSDTDVGAGWEGHEFTRANSIRNESRLQPLRFAFEGLL